MSTDLDPRLLAQLVAVAEHGDLQRAAAALAVSPRALTRGLRDLEREAGEPLLVPAAREPELTAAGVRVVEGGRRVLDALARFGAAAAEQDATLRVAHVANSDMLVRVLDRARVRARETLLADGEQLQAVADERLDVAVCTDAGPLPPGLAAVPLGDDPLMLLGDPERGVVFTAYGALWPEHDATAAALALDRGWDAVVLDAATGTGRELRALARAAAGRALLVPASTLPQDDDGAALPAGAVLRWRLAWRAADDRAVVQALLAVAPASTLSSQPST